MSTKRVKSHVRKDGTRVRSFRRKSKKKDKRTKAKERLENSGILAHKDDAIDVEKRFRRVSGGLALGGLGLTIGLGVTGPKFKQVIAQNKAVKPLLIRQRFGQIASKTQRKIQDLKLEKETSLEPKNLLLTPAAGSKPKRIPSIQKRGENIIRKARIKGRLVEPLTNLEVGLANTSIALDQGNRRLGKVGGFAVKVAPVIAGTVAAERLNKKRKAERAKRRKKRG